jgi:DNA-directed RNA polymerase specialized sigma24 family protein
MPKRHWDLTPEAFESLLSWLGPDRNQSGIKYEAIRQRLIRLFICRGSSFPEDLADDTINRVTKAIQCPDFQFVGEPVLFFYGVARNVFRESLRIKKPIPDERSEGHSEDLERQFECLDLCMNGLPPRSRDLVFQYYQEDKRAKIDNRKLLAEKMGIGLNALRIQAHRARTQLRDCVISCVERNRVK